MLEKARSGFPELEGLWRGRCPQSLRAENMERQRGLALYPKTHRNAKTEGPARNEGEEINWGSLGPMDRATQGLCGC